MRHSKTALKNDQNNHLTDQVEYFEKIAALITNNNKREFKISGYETLNSDEVTTNYVRGYN